MTEQAPIGSGFGESTTAGEIIKGIDLSGKNAIVTGGSAGMGLEIVKVLAGAGANVLVPVRNADKAKEALGGIPNVETDAMDLMDPSSIDGFAERFLSKNKPLHILINNAGVMAVPLKRDSRGNISQFSTNDLGHFQLTARLLPALRQAHGARVVSVSSRIHRLSGFNFDDPNFERREYDKEMAYAESKTGSILFAVELDKREKANGIRAFAVHPGMVPHSRVGKEGGALNRFATKLFTAFAKFFVKKQKDENGRPIKGGAKPFFKNVSQGAATAVWCAVSPQLDGMGGIYCEDCDIAQSVPENSRGEKGVWPWATDEKKAAEFWSLCERYTGVS
ncbi:MAG: SDR family NAD(P)-dependent oxidoreductase [Methanomassiliicoccaceae archaeon]|nr:SDR family NAD(P)-dependent oxidoreductase [Methanomassiliicoccaceae archaeon]